jgi:hypothetical protein
MRGVGSFDRIESGRTVESQVNETRGNVVDERRCRA